jgi:hypothetical protein
VPHGTIAEVCGVGLRSVERILTEQKPTRADVLAGERAGARRRGRPPTADAEIVQKVRSLLVMDVILVPDQQAETLARAVIASIEALGGSTKEWVFDNPKAVRISKVGVLPVVLHPFLRQLVAEYSVIPTLCAPRAGNQKGSVERLVGFVKNSFLRVRAFRDLADVDRQLAEWLEEVNFVRPSDATGVVPAVARVEEQPWLNQRPLQVRAAGWPFHCSATVTPMGTVSCEGTQYAATERHLGATATLLVRKDELEVIVNGQRSVHARADHTGEVNRAAGDRAPVRTAAPCAGSGAAERRTA